MVWEGTLQGVCSVLLPRSSASNDQALIVRKPAVDCVRDMSGILRRVESCMALKRTHADPNGMAVWETLSLTSNTVNLTLVSPESPSEERKLIVLRKPGLLDFWKHSNTSYSTLAQIVNFNITSIISVRPYWTQHFDEEIYTSAINEGFGGLPCPSQSKLSQASDISHIGTSVTSANIIWF